MIATPESPSPTHSSTPRCACPACLGTLEDRDCSVCGRTYAGVAGMADLRLASDRYLPIEAERAKADRLAEIARSTDLEGVARAYYAMTPDVDPPRCERYLAHILGAGARGEALADAVGRVDGPVLEVGCGTGGFLAAMAARPGCPPLHGVDLASRWLVVARRRLDDRDVSATLTAASADRLPWADDTFALVVADSLIEHLDDPRAALGEWLRVLRPGGRLIVWSPNRFAPIVDPHVRLWGLGYLPRSWADRYVAIRRGGAWVPRTLSAFAAAKMAREAGFRSVVARPPTISDRWAATRSSWERMAIAVANRLGTSRPGRAAMLAIGPIWTIEAIAPERSCE